MSVPSPVQLDRQRIEELIERETAALNERTRGLARDVRARAPIAERRRRLLLPVARPVADLPRRRARARASCDVDGNEYWDFHNGFGSMVQGHAHPAIVAAVRERVALGTHFAAVDRGRDRRRRGARAPLRAAALALRQLRLGGDDGRDPDRARADGPRDDREDLRLLPRPPRRRDGLDRRRPTTRSATATTSPRCPTARASRRRSST